MFDGLPLPFLVLLFAAAASAVWFAGIRLADATDILDDRWKIGAALGGIVLLAIATNLPEIAITLSAALAGNLDVAVGNILGGIAIQTVLLAAFDAFGMRDRMPLTYRAASLVLVLEGLLVVAVLTVAIMGTQLPATLVYERLSPGALLIAVIWLAGLWLVARASRGLPWHEASGNAPEAQTAPKGHSKGETLGKAQEAGLGTARVMWTFLWASALTLVAGVLLERSGDVIAGRIGMSGVLFGATVLAAATALPELSTGLRATRKGDYQLAVSDIFGGNAFLPVLFLLAALVSGKAVLPEAKATDIYLAGLGMLLTTVYVAGLIFRPRRRIAGIGIDSLTAILLYLLGTAGLIAIAMRGTAP